jgi:Ca2+-binding EF-hand superfamily protein/mono/diheme cytochrome c family protein/thiol-disulfide isomerase/thioredoxin
MKRICSHAIVLALVLTPAFAAERLLTAISGVMLQKKFKELDTDGDGRLTAAEAGDAPWFKRLDVNGDGALTTDEVREALASATRNPGQKAARALGNVGSPEDVFKAADKDGDGKVTPDELKRPELFKLLDRNNDGVITLVESRPFLERLAKPQASDDSGGTASAPFPARQGPRILKPGDVGIGRMIPDISFTDLAGTARKLSDFQDGKGIAIAFTSTTCPVSKRYAPSLARLESELRGKGVALLLVNPFASEKPDALRAEVKARGFQAPYIHDRDGAVARALDARSTTEVFLLDAKRTLVYCGALDDQYGVDYNLDAPTERYLVSAVDAMLAGKRPAIAATAAPGCELDVPRPATTTATPVTYHRDITRILQQNCVECHHDKGIAPFALTDADEVTDRAKVIRRVVTTGTMPPWFAAPPAAGQESPWVNDRSLSTRDRNDLLSWLDAPQRPLGNPADAPAPLKLPDEWTIGKPDLVVQLNKPIAIKADGFMPYQFTTVETTLTEDKWVQAYEIIPTAREVVHHVIVQVHAKGSRFKRGGEGEDGYWAAYVPGNTSHVYPDGVARKLPAGATVSFQIHYTPNGKATEDQLKMGLVFAKEPPKFAVHTAAVAGRRLNIPPGEANHVETAQQKVPVDLHVSAFMAHMHVRGKAFKFDVTYPDGRSETLLDIPRYDFNWQLRYEYKEPRTIPKGSTVKITAVYDNSAGNKANPDPTKTVHWGPQTVDEMMLGYIEHFTPMPTAQTAALR